MTRPFAAANEAARHNKATSVGHFEHPLGLRGGADMPPLYAVADYSDVARNLFGNFITPASLIISALVSMTLQQLPVPKYGNSFRKKLRGMYYTLCLLATTSEMICIITASIASSRIMEAGAATPTKSAFDLILRDYELAWVATSVHFMGGLMGFLAASGVGAYLSFPKKYNTASACAAAAAFLWIIRLVYNRALTLHGNGPKNYIDILKRYCILTAIQLQQSSYNILDIASFALAALSATLMIRALVSSEDE